MKTTPTPLLALWTAVCMAMLAGNLDGQADAAENGVPVVEANVGVTLLVNDGRIIAADRNDEGITFGEIVIPPAVAAQPGGA